MRSLAGTAAVWWLTQSGPEPCPREAPVCGKAGEEGAGRNRKSDFWQSAAVLAQDWHTALGLAQNPWQNLIFTLASSMGFEYSGPRTLEKLNVPSHFLPKNPPQSQSPLAPTAALEVFPAPQRPQSQIR